MTVKNGFAKIAGRLGRKLKKLPACTGTAILAGGMLFCGSAAAEEVDFEDFEGLPLEPFVVALGGDGTDWTTMIRPGTDREWTVDNSGMLGQTGEPGYDGFTAMDVDSWIGNQGEQLGRTSLGAGTNNTALVADPDAWDDFLPASQPLGFNSFISRSYDLTGFNVQTLKISFDYEFASYDFQLGTVDVSFDGGATFQNLLELDSETLGNSVLISNMQGPPDPPGDGTDWTNQIRTGTDREWTIDNSGNSSMSLELAYDGFAVLDVNSWVEQQGVQLGRTLFASINPNNSTLVIDGDAFSDFAEPAISDNGINSYICREYDLTGFDSEDVTISFEYEFGAYAESTGLCEVSFDGGATYQTLLELSSPDLIPPKEVEALITGFAELKTGSVGADSMKLRFGYVDADDDWWFAIDNVFVTAGGGFSDLEDFEGLDLQPFGVAAVNPRIIEPSEFCAADGDFEPTSSEMILRIGCTMADNDWWFAVDNILIEADTAKDCLLGDVDQNGSVNLFDVDPFVAVIAAGEFQCEADVNKDGVVTLEDVDPFVALLSGP